MTVAPPVAAGVAPALADELAHAVRDALHLDHWGEGPCLEALYRDVGGAIDWAVRQESELRAEVRTRILAELKH